MRHLAYKNPAPAAKRRNEIRPFNGMPRALLFAALGFIWAIAGCFDVKYANCHVACLQSENFECPNHLMCIKQDEGATIGLCAPAGTTPATCFGTPDAGTDADAMEAGTDSSDAMETGTDANDGGSGPPEILCHNGNCFTLPAAVRENLVLLLWPSNLPAVGATVSVWADQSGKGNDAHALYPSALPRVIANGVQLDASQFGSGFIVANSPSLDVAADDFAAIVVAGLSSSATPVSFLRKSDGAREDSRQISLDWVRASSNSGRPQGAVNDTVVATNAGIPEIAQPSVGVYTLQRATDRLELHRNGTVLGSADLPTAGASTSNAADVYVGVTGILGSPADSIQAVIAIRGSISAFDLNQLEIFLRDRFATAAPL